MMHHVPRGVAHLELHTDDRVEALGFLSRLLGWRSEEVGPAESAYVALGVGDRISGGIVECGTSSPQWLPYVVVDRLERATERATELGACTLLGPREGPAGWRTVIAAPAIGALALWQLKTGRSG
jgi:predicted enzyme related to lactoylglutathione lyase